MFLGPFLPKGIQLLHVLKPYNDPCAVTHGLSSSGASILAVEPGWSGKLELDAQLGI